MVSYERTRLQSPLQSSFRENDDKIVCVLWSGGVSDFDYNFGSVLRILALKPAGVGLVSCEKSTSQPTSS